MIASLILMADSHLHPHVPEMSAGGHECVWTAEQRCDRFLFNRAQHLVAPVAFLLSPPSLRSGTVRERLLTAGVRCSLVPRPDVAGPQPPHVEL